jgi:hypothetical protein
MKCPHCSALFAYPLATETEANVTNGQNKKEGSMEVTVFSCPVCEAVFNVHPEEPEDKESKAPAVENPLASTRPSTEHSSASQ